jgi:hypothetical protein
VSPVTFVIDSCAGKVTDTSENQRPVGGRFAAGAG